CERNDCSPPSTGSGRAIGWLAGRRRGLLDVRRGGANLGADIGRAANLVDAAFHVFGRELALDLTFDVLPAVARAAHERTDGARDARQALRTEHQQRDHRDQRDLAETDLEHGTYSGFGAVGLGLARRGLARGRRRIGLQLILRVAVLHAL